MKTVERNNSLNKLFDLGKRHFENHNYKKAKKYLNAFLKQEALGVKNNQHKNIAFLYVGCIHKEEKKYEEAIDYFQRIRMSEFTKEDVAYIFIQLGESFASINKYKKAVVLIKKGIKNYKRDDIDIVLFNLAGSLAHMNAYNKAIKCYLNILKVYGSSSLKNSVLFKLGTSYYSIKKYNQAKEYFSQFLESYSKPIEYVAHSHYYLAHIYFLEKKHQETIEEYILYLETGIEEELHGLVRINIAKNYKALNKHAYVIKEAERALKLNLGPNDKEDALGLIIQSAKKLNMIDLSNLYKQKLKKENPESRFLENK